ncbi:MAG: trehalose-phosphatase [Bryobacteraceae bacterium]|nr:trehalose-phosphatase [Bryobacteraceae bacterium]
MIEPELIERIRAAGSAAFFLDFDGTLTPIAQRPEEAWLDAGARAAIGALMRGGTVVAIVSGRSLTDLSKRAGGGCFYAGNHGLEILTPRGLYVHPEAAAARGALAAIVAELRARTAAFAGVRVEDKELTASVHFRLAPQWEPRLREMAREAARPFAERIEIREGKMVLEVRPAVQWNKGDAARFILRTEAPAAVPVVIGDDSTDEDMFAAMPEGVTIAVGNGVSGARYRLQEPAEVIALLNAAATLLAGGPDRTPR